MLFFLHYFLAFLMLLPTVSCRRTSQQHHPPEQIPETIPEASDLQTRSTTQVQYHTFVDPLLLAKLDRYYLIHDPSLGLSDSDSTEQVLTISSIIAGSLLVAEGGAYGVRKYLAATEKRPRALVPEAELVTRHSPSPTLEVPSPSPKVEGAAEHISPPPDVKGLRKVYLEKPEELIFAPQEEHAIIQMETNNPFLEQLRQAPTQSIIRGSSEYRLFAATKHYAYVSAFDLRPQFELRREAIKQAVAKKQTYIPAATYRSDPRFAMKTEAIKRLGATQEGQAPLDLTQKGRLVSAAEKHIDFEVEKKLGSGEYGDVFQVKFTPQGEEPFLMAIKQPNKKALQDGLNAREQADLTNEIIHLDGMTRHPNSMQFYGAYPLPKDGVKERGYALAMEIVASDWRSLAAYNLPPRDKTRLMIGAADGFAAMHASSYVHFDIKPANLFFSRIDPNEPTSEVLAKLGDFGFTRYISAPTMLPASNLHGTYRSPAIISTTPPGTEIPGNPFKEDVFALGISLIELRAGPNSWTTIYRCCYRKYQDHFVIQGEDAFRQLEHSLNSAGINKDELALLKRMISNQAELRPTMQEVATELRALHRLSNI